MKSRRLDKSYFERDNIYIGILYEPIKIHIYDDELLTILSNKNKTCGSILYEKINGMAHDLINDLYFKIDEIDKTTNKGVLIYINIKYTLKKLGFDEILSYDDIKKIYKLFLKSNKLYLEHGMCYGNNSKITRSMDKEDWDKLILAKNLKNYKCKNKSKKLVKI